MGAPWIVVGHVLADDGDVIVRMIVVEADGQQVLADLPSSSARELAALLETSANRAEAEDARITAGAKALLEDYCKRECIAPLEERLADCLAECVDGTLLTVRDTWNGADVELRLGSFRPDLSERAAELLEEAGR